MRIRDGEVIKVPMISMSIVWHDGTGSNREAFFQMSDSDWAHLNLVINDLTDSREDLQSLIETYAPTE